MPGLDLTRRLVAMAPVRATAAWGSLTPRDVRFTASGTTPFDADATLAWLDSSARRESPFSDAKVIRPALRQLALGLEALHASGVQHRDVKPSNVMVSHRGRVVILDFGLASHTADVEGGQSVQGTPAYMAPEQAYGVPSAASDLYAVGVMLFEALTGRLPFHGSVYEVVAAKQLVDCPPPSSIVQGIDADLDGLCADLMKRHPEERPRPADVLRRIERGARIPEIRGRQKSKTTPFVGREAHMEDLRAAARGASEGRAITVTVHGVSGMGKSALVRRFLDEVKQEHHAVVLRGRCYERESVPYKAVDALMDALSRLLLSERPETVSALLPPNILALARLFPVLNDVPAVAVKTHGEDDVPDLQELRRRGFGALRELFARMAKDRPLVLAIDDLQWGDADSAALLTDLLRPPNPPPILLVCSFRSDEAASSPFLREIMTEGSSFRDAGRGALDIRDIEVGPLSQEQATALASQLLEGGHEDLEPAVLREMASQIACEAEGNPFFVAELVRAIDFEHEDERGRSQPPPSSSREESASPRSSDRHTVPPRLDQVVRARVARLSEEARALLEVVAVAGRPVEQGIALRAAGQSSEAIRTLGLLRSEHLVRTRGVGLHDLVEPYHDRIREAVLASLDVTNKKTRHLALAEGLEAGGRADPETLCEHFVGAGDRLRAQRYATLAAKRAASTLAFDRAATLHRTALDHADRSDPNHWRISKDLGEALAQAGRSAEAWVVLNEAVEGAPEREALELERLAAEHACRSGHVDEGVAIFRKVTGAVGMRMAKSPTEALASLLARRALVRLRGLKYAERSESSVDPDLLRKLDVCYSVSVGLAMIDPIQGADFQARLLLLALEAGEPLRLARALAIEACYSSTGGEDARERTSMLVDVADAMAKRVGSPHALSMVESARAFDDVFVGRWRRGLAHAERAEKLMRENCTSVAHEIATAQIFGLWALFNLGELPELVRRYPEQVRYAEERGDLFAAGSKRTLVGHLVHLCKDDVAGARETVRLGMLGWSQRGFHVQHWYELASNVNTDMYAGDGQGAFERIDGKWREAERSLLMRIISIRNDILFLRGRAALAAARTSKNPKKLLDVAESDAKKIANAALANAEGWSRTLMSAVHHQRGDRPRAIAEARKAAKALHANDMTLWGHILEHREGQMVGGLEGAHLVERAETWMRERGILRPDRFADMLAPGIGESEPR